MFNIPQFIFNSSGIRRGNQRRLQTAQEQGEPDIGTCVALLLPLEVLGKPLSDPSSQYLHYEFSDSI